MAKLTFEEVLEKMADGQSIKREEVLGRALDRWVWVASNGLPGCLNDNSDVFTTKRDAAQSIIDSFAHVGDMIVPKGLVTALREKGETCIFDLDGYRYRVEKMRLVDLF